jgi:hypothetical protein
MHDEIDDSEYTEDPSDYCAQPREEMQPRHPHSLDFYQERGDLIDKEDAGNNRRLHACTCKCMSHATPTA